MARLVIGWEMAEIVEILLYWLMIRLEQIISNELISAMETQVVLCVYLLSEAILHLVMDWQEEPIKL